MSQHHRPFSSRVTHRHRRPLCSSCCCSSTARGFFRQRSRGLTRQHSRRSCSKAARHLLRQTSGWITRRPHRRSCSKSARRPLRQTSRWITRRSHRRSCSKAVRRLLCQYSMRLTRQPCRRSCSKAGGRRLPRLYRMLVLFLRFGPACYPAADPTGEYAPVPIPVHDDAAGEPEEAGNR